MNTPQLAAIAGLAGFAIAHAWLGERWLLPRVFALPRFRESFYFAPTPRVRGFLRIAWQLGAVAWLWVAALVLPTWWLDTSHARELVMVPMLLMAASPLIVGTFLGALLKPKVGKPTIGVTILLWVALLFATGAAWYGA